MIGLIIFQKWYLIWPVLKYEKALNVIYRIEYSKLLRSQDTFYLSEFRVIGEGSPTCA